MRVDAVVHLLRTGTRWVSLVQSTEQQVLALQQECMSLNGGEPGEAKATGASACKACGTHGRSGLASAPLGWHGAEAAGVLLSQVAKLPND